MFILVGILATAAVILAVLYFYVFKTMHQVLSYLILFGVSISLIATMFMHLMLAGIFTLSIGLLLIRIAESQKIKNAAKKA